MTELPRETWKRIRMSGKGDGNIEVPSLPTDVETGFGPAVLATGPNGEARLLVPHGKVRGHAEANSGPNLLVGYSSYICNGRNISFIDIMLVDPRLDKVFEEVVLEILNRLRRGTSPDKAVTGAIHDFRQLLLGPSSNISTSTIVGLMGELIVLERLCELSSSAIKGWTGPFEQRHDFRRGSLAIEVKTSMRSDASRVSIHGFDQLQPPINGSLLLSHVRLEKADAGHLTVATLVDQILSHGVDAGLLEKSLAALSCLDYRATEWNKQSFEFEGLNLYKVEGSFPRITCIDFSGGIIPAGVVSLEYQIDLGIATEYLVPNSDVSAVLSEFML